MEYTIVIITYNRVDKCLKKTLTFLKTNNIPRERINLVVHSQEEADKYNDGIPAEYYNEILITGLNDGCHGQMNWVFNHFEEGKYLLKLDDDISSVLELKGDKLEKTTDLEKIIEKGFKLCEDHSFKFWGLYPSKNDFFIKGQVTEYSTDLKFVVGALMGIINEKILLDLNIKIKGDYDYGIQSYLRNGGLIRLNKIGFKYDLAKNTGDRTEVMKNDADILMGRYPDLVRTNNLRKKGEILYKRSKKNNEIVFKQPKSVSNNKLKAKVEEYEEVLELPKIDPSSEDLLEVYNLLESIAIPCVDNGTGRSGTFGRHRAMTMGMIRARVSREYGLSLNSRKNPELYEALIKFGKTIVPFDFNAIQVNHNVVCPRHLDPYNSGNSCLISFGDYEGCNLIIEGHGEYNTNCSPIVFNGAKVYHYNTPFKSGNKYSLVFFTNSH